MKKIPWELKLAIPTGLAFILFGVLDNAATLACGCLFALFVGIYIGKMIYAQPFAKHPANYGFVKEEEMAERVKIAETGSHLAYAPGPGQTGDKDYRTKLNKGR